MGVTAKGDRRMLSVRVSQSAFVNLDHIATRDGVDRSTAHRRLLAYALLNMPRGWKPPGERR